MNEPVKTSEKSRHRFIVMHNGAKCHPHCYNRLKNYKKQVFVFTFATEKCYLDVNMLMTINENRRI